MSDELTVHINLLRDVRVTCEKLKAVASARMRTVTEDPEYIAVVRHKKETEALVESLEADIRTVSERIYLATGDKHPNPFVENTDGTEYIIEDPAATEAWARVMMAAAFKLDTRMVLEHAKKNDVPGIVKKEVVKVRIATNLNPEGDSHE